MAEEFVELGFEGLDRFADRYFDRTYNHLPSVPRLGRRKSQPQQRQLPSGASPKHPDKGFDSTQPRLEDAYINSEMYGTGGQDGYARDQRYYEADRLDYMNRAPGPGFRVPRDQSQRDGGWSTQPYVQAGPRARGRPEPQRRGSSWSPPRSERRGRSESRRVRSRSRSGSQSRADDAKRRFIATVGGALVGGLAGNQVGKGRQYDTAATVAGAILGGVGAREVADHWDRARQKKREARGERWQGDYGNGEGRRSEKMA